MMSAVLKPVLERRSMGEGDLDDVMALELRAYPFPWSRGNFADSLRAGYRAWVWMDGGRLAGYGLVALAVDEAQLLNIAVEPVLQGRGLGAYLLAGLMADARDCGAQRMFLEVRPSNLPAQALYLAHGFVAVGRRKHYYPAAAGREDAIVMAREL